MAHRLLVIEDEAPVREMLRLLLEDEGFQIVEAAHGEEGLERFAADAPDLLLVDLRLPGMHGLEVCRAVRQAKSGLPLTRLARRSGSIDAAKAIIEKSGTSRNPTV